MVVAAGTLPSVVLALVAGYLSRNMIMQLCGTDLGSAALRTIRTATRRRSIGYGRRQQ
jgi:hypothetical protein